MSRLFNFGLAIALMGLTACQTTPPEAETPPPADEVAESPATESTPITETTPPDDVPDRAASQAFVMARDSFQAALCNDGAGVLAISYVGEAGYDGQLLGCESDFNAFDTARENEFTDIDPVAPMMADEVLQLQTGEYVAVQCEGDRVSLAPVLPDNSDGNMTLECF